MKEFCKDYWSLCKDTGRFMKKHWKGCIALNVALFGAEVAWLNRNNIKDYIEEKFGKEESQ